MFRMTKALLAAAVALLAGAMTSPASAQQPTSVTGCLSKGPAEDAFKLIGTDGQTYSLTSSTVKLDQHVGHKVTVTGTPAGVETGALADTSAKKEPGMTKDTSITKNAGATSAGVLSVNSLKMVSAECK
jgi:hypothetical protein